MRRHPSLTPADLIAIVVLSLPVIAAKSTDHGLASYARYVQIPGATATGADKCAACHEDIAREFRHAFHAQRGVECEECHGPGSSHVEAGGDVSKIISFHNRSAADANGVCLSCHAQDPRTRNWIAGSHAANNVRCTDCHETHASGTKASSRRGVPIDVMAPRRVAEVDNRVPEAKAMMQTRWQANDACLTCHPTERAQMSLPYHHPLREGKVSCADCHDPHGGAGGNNLRMANANQLCLSCHAQYRGPYAYQHPPVTEDCMICHTAHGSANAKLLNLSQPALCLQCHAGHHNGAGLPLPDRCTNCHGSIHGTDTPTPSGGSRFVDKGPSEPQLLAAHPAAGLAPVHTGVATPPSVSWPATTNPAGALGALGVLSSLAPMSSRSAWSSLGEGAPEPADTGTTIGDALFSILPGYRFVDQSGYAGRVGEYDTLQQSAGADVAASFVSPEKHLAIVARGNVLSSQDYQAAFQVVAGQWAKVDFDMRSFVQQQDHVPFYAFPVLDIPPGSTVPPDSSTDLIPSQALFSVVRRLGQANAEVKIPKLPIRLFLAADWQARSGATQLAYLDENTTPAVYSGGVNTTCGLECHHQSQLQSLDYTTRNLGLGADLKLGSVYLKYLHKISHFDNHAAFPTATFTGPFTPENEGSSVVNPPPAGPAPQDVAAGDYFIDIPSPSHASSDHVILTWTPSASLSFNGSAGYTKLTNTFTSNAQNVFDADNTLIWRPIDRLRFTADYHQYNVINDFTPYYSLYGNMSFHNHREGVRVKYDLAKGFDVEGRYQRSGITRSNAFLWPQVYSIDNTDLQMVVPSSTSDTVGLAVRYHDHSLWRVRAGYEWTGTEHPGYLVVPTRNHRIVLNVALKAASWLTFWNDANVILQDGSAAIALPNNPGDFERSSHFYIDTASASLQIVPSWNLGLGYSYQQNDLTSYMAFQNDAGVGYVLNQAKVPFKQISQSYWGESTCTLKERLGFNLRVTYNSARSGFRPDLNPNDAALLGNQALIASGSFSPDMFAAAQANMGFSATQISEVIVPQWIGQAKAYYLLPRKFESGLVFYYGSYRDYWNPNLNGVLRTFNVYLGRSW